MAHTKASAKGTAQQQQQQGRPKERKDSPPKRTRTEMQDSQVEHSTADAADGPEPRSPGKTYPAVTEKRVFFERYTDSPEFLRVRNPVVHVRNRRELNDVIDPTSKLANYQSPMDRRKWAPIDLRRVAVFGAQKLANADAINKNQRKLSTEQADVSSNLSLFAGNGENLADDGDDEDEDDDDDEEGPDDDTFEFLLN